jgi:hypothetical protein
VNAHNMSANADPQLQKAASPQVLQPSCLQRRTADIWKIEKSASIFSSY